MTDKMSGHGDPDRGMPGMKQTTKGKDNSVSNLIKAGRGGGQETSLRHSVHMAKKTEQPEWSQVEIKQEERCPPFEMNIKSGEVTATIEEATSLTQDIVESAKNLCFVSPCRPTKKRVGREDVSQGSVRSPATKVAKEGDGKQESEKLMEVDSVVAEFDVSAGNDEENERMMLAMKEAEDLDEESDDNMELEPPTLARGGEIVIANN